MAKNIRTSYLVPRNLLLLLHLHLLVSAKGIFGEGCCFLRLDELCFRICVSPIFVGNFYSYFQRMIRGTPIRPFHRGTIGKILANGKPDVSFIGNTIIGRVKSQPTIKWNVSFYPRVRCTFTTHPFATRANVSTHITGRHIHEPEHHQKYMGEILTHP